MTRAARLLRIADQLGKMPAVSIEADSTMHDALGLAGAVLPYTRMEAAARKLLPVGFEWVQSIYSGGFVYAACRRSGWDGEWPPHHGQWGSTLPLAMCEVVVRVRSALVQG